MMELCERNLKIQIPKGALGRKFDDENHGLSHCMKAVDFILEFTDKIYFVEFKDPDNPKASDEDRQKFLAKFSLEPAVRDLAFKFRDSWLYENAEDRVKKPISYLVLIAAKALDKPKLLTVTDHLKRQIPCSGPGGRPWKKPFAAGCAVMNIDEWNTIFPTMLVSRVQP